MNNEINTKKFDEEFNTLKSTNKLKIDSIEDIMSKAIEDYKSGLIKHVEELLKDTINEKEIIAKKNKNGKKKKFS